MNSKYYSKNASSLGWGEESASLDKERVELIKKFIKGKKVLDVGCGIGIYVDFLSSLGFESVGIDFVSEFIEKAKKNMRGVFVRAKADKLPFKEREFDTVLLFDILEHGDDLKILNEAKIVGNRFLVIVPRKVDIDLQKSGVIFRHYLDKSHLREYESKDLEKLAKNCNLKLVYLEKVHPLYNETIFLSLFEGSVFLKKLIRKLVFLLLPNRIYPTEYFAVLDR